MQVHLQEVVGDNLLAQTGIVLLQIGHRLGVYLHHPHGARLLHQVLCEHTHAGSHLQYGQVGAGVHRVGYPAGYVKVGQKVLTQILLRSYLSHTYNLSILP